jgi:hypothetical protein
LEQLLLFTFHAPVYKGCEQFMGGVRLHSLFIGSYLLLALCSNASHASVPSAVHRVQMIRGGGTGSMGQARNQNQDLFSPLFPGNDNEHQGEDGNGNGDDGDEKDEDSDSNEEENDDKNGNEEKNGRVNHTDTDTDTDANGKPNAPRARVRRAPSVRRMRRPFRQRTERKLQYFLSTTAFVHGDTFFGLGRTTSGILFGYFAVLYAVYVLCTTLLLYVRRKDPSLAKFPLWITHFIPAALNAVIVVTTFVRHMFRARFPCFVVLWLNSLIAPMYVVLTFEARSLHLIFEYHWSKRMQSMLQATESKPSPSGAPYVDSTHQKTIVLSQPEHRRVQLQARVSSPQPTLTRSSHDWYWIKKHGTMATVSAVFAFQFFMTASIQIFSPYYRIWPKMDVYRCTGTLETVLPLITLGIYLFALPAYLFIHLRRINDSYGVRQDLFNAVSQSAWVSILFSLRHVYFLEQFVGYLPSGFAVLGCFGLLHYHSVCAPLLRIYTWQWSRSRKNRRMKQLIYWKRRVETVLFPRWMRIRSSSTPLGAKHKGRPERSSTRSPATPPLPIIDAADVPAIQPKPKRSIVSRFIEQRSDSMFPVASLSPSNASPSPVSPALSPDLVPPSFAQVLQDDHLCELFERYTLLEFSRENLLFYRAICQMRSTHSALPPAAAQIFLVEKARSIHAQFIKQAAPAEVNISGVLRSRIEARLADVTAEIGVSIFDEAQKEVFRLMQSWSFPRFLRTLPEDEIKKFNRKQRRNSIPDAGNVVCQVPQAFRPERRHSQVALNINDTFQLSASPMSFGSPGSTSTSGMPSNIAFYSLSSSP